MSGGGGGVAVGGVAEMAKKLELLAPWIAVGILLMGSIPVVVLRNKRRGSKRRKCHV
jgi:hypothetical protein